MADSNVTWDLIARDRASSALRRIAGETDTLHGKTVAAAKGMALLAGGAAIAGVTSALRTGFNEITDYQKGLAQLQAGLKSTHDVSNTTVKGLEALASSIQSYSGQTDDSVVAAEQLLLTFPRVRNEAGAMNDVFNQAVKISADLAARLGGDASSQAIRLGRALDDPIRGLTALTRVGVSFTDQQREQVKALVESGDVLGAQKIILGELNREFAGSARAFGNTLPGQIEKTKRAWEDTTQEMVGALLPAFRGVVGLLQHDVIPAIRDTTHFVKDNKEWLEPLTKTLLIGAGAWKAYSAAAKLATGLRLGKGAVGAAESVAGTAVGRGSSPANPLYVVSVGAPVGPPGSAGPVAREAESQGGRLRRFFNSDLSKALIAPAVGYSVFKALSSNLSRGGIGIPGLFQIGGQKKVDPEGLLSPSFRKEVDALGGVDKALAYYRKLNLAASGSADEMANSSARAAAGIHAQAKELAAAQSKALALSQGQDDLRNAIHNMAVVVGGQSSRALQGNSDAALANRDALRGAVSSALDYLSVLKQHGASAPHVADVELKLAKAIERSATKTYGDKAAVDELLSSLGFVPSEIQAIIDKYNELHQVWFDPTRGTGAKSPFRDPGHPGYVPPDVTTTATKVGKITGKNVTDGYSSVVSPGVASATKKAFDDAKQRARADAQEIIGFFKQTKQELVSTFASISTETMTDSLGGSYNKAQAVQSQLQQAAQQMHRFARLWHKLDDLGLDPRLLAQFNGPDYIPAMQEILASGRKGIRRDNRLERRIAHDAGTVAMSATADKYGQLAHHDMVSLPPRIGKEFGKELRKHGITLLKLDRMQGHKVAGGG